MITLNVSNILEKGARSTTLTDVLAHMTPAEAKKFMNDNSKYVVLQVGNTLWLPFGHTVWTVGTSTEAAVLMWQPVLAESLYVKLPQKVITDIKETMDAFLTSAQQEPPWNKHYESVRRWMGMK